jgi:hypothetical protein
MVLTASAEYLHWSPVAPERMRSLARLIASLPEELLTPFLAEIEQARIAALAAAAEEIHPA